MDHRTLYSGGDARRVFVGNSGWRIHLQDDNALLTDNAAIQRQRRKLHTIWFTTKLVDYLPVTSTSLWIEWRLVAHRTRRGIISRMCFCTRSSAILALARFKTAAHSRCVGSGMAVLPFIPYVSLQPRGLPNGKTRSRCFLPVDHFAVPSLRR